MANEGQQPPLPEQGPSEQQPYYGWQYDQDNSGQMAEQSPAAPAHPVYPPAQYSPAYIPPNQGVPPLLPQNQGGPPHPLPPGQGGPPKPLPPQYQRPVQDMGTSLGYGQGMEYQYFNAPQPSQPLPLLRQARLQQLREERMRRQQRRMNPDITSLIQGKTHGRPSNVAPSPVVPPQQVSPTGNPGMPVAAPLSPAMPVPPVEVSPSLIRPPMPVPALQHGPSGPPVEINQSQPAAAPAQDTGMIQKVRIGRAALILQGAFIASRILGLLRTSMFAFIFGTTITSDAFLQAFLVPDLIFNIVAGGALSSAFIPVFTYY
ncbi:MAG TPA: lipid II flippase MurJ, partial [Ktedonobacteraceae bacterium]